MVMEQLDMYMTRGQRYISDVIQVGSNKIKGNLQPPRGGDPKTLFFRSEGEINIQIYPYWLSLSNILIGSSGAPSIHEIIFPLPGRSRSQWIGVNRYNQREGVSLRTIPVHVFGLFAIPIAVSLILLFIL